MAVRWEDPRHGKAKVGSAHGWAHCGGNLWGYSSPESLVPGHEDPKSRLQTTSTCKPVPKSQDTAAAHPLVRTGSAPISLPGSQPEALALPLAEVKF